MDGPTLGWLALFFIALLCSAFFSGSEAAFLSVQRARMAHLVRTGTRGAEGVASLVGKPEKLLPTVLTGNNLANTSAAAIGTILAASVLSPNTAVVVATAAVTILLLLLGEIIPKTLAIRNAERMAIALVGPLRIVSVVLSPAAWILERISHGIGRLVGVTRSDLITEEEIRSLILTGRDAGALEASEANMLEQVFHFGDRPVLEVMTPRTEVVWIEKEATLEQFLETYNHHSHTRFPVYHGHPDNVVGILSVKDVLIGIAQGELKLESPMAGMVRLAHYVPQTKLIGDLFKELTGARAQMAMVVDEFGGVAGLVTLKRLMEQIVGPLGEESGDVVPDVQSIDERTYEMDGSLRVEEANEQLNLEIPSGEYETVAGFLLHRLRRIPNQGDYLLHNHFRLVVTEMRGVKIEKVRVVRILP